MAELPNQRAHGRASPGTGRTFRLETFLGFLGDIRRALLATDRYVSGVRDGTTYHVADLKHDSPSTVLEGGLRGAPGRGLPPQDVRGAVLGTFVHGLDDILQGRQPAGLTSR